MMLRPEPHLAKSPTTYQDFYPHITLASLPISEDPNAVDRLKKSIQTIPFPAFDVTFKSLDIGDHYNRAVFVRVDLSSDLVALQTKVHEIIGVAPRIPEFPHVSLCYIAD